MTSIEALNECIDLEDLYDLTCKLKPQTGRLGGWTFFLPDQTGSLSNHDLVRRLKSIYRDSLRNRETAETALKLVDRIRKLDDRGRALVIPWYMILLTFVKYWLESFKYESYYTLNKIEKKAQNLFDQTDSQEEHQFCLDPEFDVRETPDRALNGIQTLSDKKQIAAMQKQLDNQLKEYPAVSCGSVAQQPDFQLMLSGSDRGLTFDKEALQSQIGNGSMSEIFTGNENQIIELTLPEELFDLLCDYLYQGDVPKKISQLSEISLVELYENAHDLIIPRLEIQCALEILRRLETSEWKNDDLLEGTVINLLNDFGAKELTKDTPRKGLGM